METTRISAIWIAVAAFLVGGAMALSESVNASGAQRAASTAIAGASVKPSRPSPCAEGASPCAATAR